MRPLVEENTMAVPAKSGVSERLEELERTDRRRVWETAVKPLSESDVDRASDSAIVPVEMLNLRFDELEKSIATVRRDLHVQAEALRGKGRLAWWGLAALAIAVALFVVLLRVAAI